MPNEAELAELFGLFDIPALTPRFNIAPSQPIAVIRTPGKLELLRWGLVLPNAKGTQGINVRVESVAKAPAYRESFRKRRCLVIVDAFYEWQRTGKTKQAFAIRREDRKPFALAGIWDENVTTDGEIIDACAVITGSAQGVVKPLHDRMPLIVRPSEGKRWLDQAANVDDLLQPDANGLIAYSVSARVNSPAFDDAQCLEPEEPPQLGLAF